MPPVSEKQRRLMWAARNDPSVRERTGISKRVAKDFTGADPGGKLPEQVKEGKPVRKKREPGNRGWYDGPRG